jgi:hypothetical protein
MKWVAIRPLIRNQPSASAGKKGRDLMPPKGAIILGEVARHLATIDISCNFCPRRGLASVGRLMQQPGPDMPVPDLLRLLSHDCPRRPGGPHRRAVWSALAAAGGGVREWDAGVALALVESPGSRRT